jgi:hypothetical protein
MQVAEWLGRRLRRPHARKFLGNPQERPLEPELQTHETIDCGVDDGDLGEFEDEADQGLLIRGARAARAGAEARARCLWAAADAAVSAAQADEALKEQLSAAGSDDASEDTPGGGVEPCSSGRGGEDTDLPRGSASAHSSDGRMHIEGGDSTPRAADNAAECTTEAPEDGHRGRRACAALAAARIAADTVAGGGCGSPCRHCGCRGARCATTARLLRTAT